MPTTVESSKVLLPLSKTANAKVTCNTCTEQSGLIKLCPAYATTPTVSGVVVDMDTAVAALQATNGKIDNLLAELSAAKTTRTVQLATVRLKHDAVATALNTASNGDPQAAQAWVGKTKVQTKPAPVTASVTPPLGAGARAIKRRHGAVRAFCDAEPGMVSTLFQTGADALHPENWGNPIVSPGHTYTFNNLPVGQPFNVRMAIVRRGSVQSQWTQVFTIIVT